MALFLGGLWPTLPGSLQQNDDPRTTASLGLGQLGLEGLHNSLVPGYAAGVKVAEAEGTQEDRAERALLEHSPRQCTQQLPGTILGMRDLGWGAESLGENTEELGDIVIGSWSPSPCPKGGGPGSV